MKNLLLVALISVCLPVSAEFMKRDWLVQGDQLVTLDTESSLEWLNLSVHKAKIISNSPMNIYRRTLDEVEVGYEFLNYNLRGWRVANQQEVESLFAQAFPALALNTDKYSYAAHLDPVTTVASTNFFEFGGDINNIPKAVFCRSIESAYNKDCNLFGAGYGEVYGPENTSLANMGINGLGVWLVRGVQVPPDNTCPAIITEMTRQQALEYIEHLSTQLVDPNVTVITPLNL
jgi:hypothetical protein